MKAKIHRRYKFTYGQFLCIVFGCILFFSIFLFLKVNKKITPNLLRIAESSIDKLNETILTNYRVKDIYREVDLSEAIHLVKNNKDEIISVDFDLENVYKALAVITGYLQESVENIELRKQILHYYNEDLSSNLDSIILSVPMGVLGKGIYTVNLGPRIPVKISYMGYVSSSVRITVEDYGINNCLVSVFIDCFISNAFIVPTIEKEVNHEYNILIASKIVQGIVPSYYGGMIEAKSNVLNVPIQ